METSLHQELKAVYADEESQLEAPLGSFRIDVLTEDELIEIQHGPLAAIRDKVACLLKDHRLLVVKPIVVRKTIVRQDRKGGRVVSRRRSPKQCSILDLFHELVYFTRVFPHPNLVLEVPMVDIEELRYPGHGRRRRWRKNDHQVEDQRLVEIREIRRFRTGRDLANLLPPNLPSPFHTQHVAEALQVDRWVAQRIAYCFREMKIARQVGKQGNTRLYQWSHSRRDVA